MENLQNVNLSKLKLGRVFYGSITSGTDLSTIIFETGLPEDNVLEAINIWFTTLSSQEAQEHKTKLYALNVFRLHQYATLFATYRLSKRAFKIIYGCTKDMYKRAKYLASSEEYYIRIDEQEASRFSSNYERRNANLGEHVYLYIKANKDTLLGFADSIDREQLTLEYAFFTWCNTLHQDAAIKYCTDMAQINILSTFKIARGIAVSHLSVEGYVAKYGLYNKLPTIAAQMVSGLEYYKELSRIVKNSGPQTRPKVPLKYALPSI